MDDLNDKITGGTLSATEWNQVPTEMQNIIEDTDQTLSGADLNQLGKGVAKYVGNGDFYTDSGSANAYVLTTVGGKQAPTSYVDGMRIRFTPGNVPTGASTVNVASLGVKNLKNADGNALSSGYFNTLTPVEASYNSGAGEFRLDRRIGGEYIKLADVKSTNTAGGTFTSGAWQTRTLIEITDTGENCSVSSNQFTLDAGTYRISASSPANDVNRHQAKLYNITDVADVIIGSSHYATVGGNDQALVVGEFTITASKAFELQHQAQTTTASDGFGVAANLGEDETYTVVELWKIN